jgi:hypothetical protein
MITTGSDIDYPRIIRAMEESHRITSGFFDRLLMDFIVAEEGVDEEFDRKCGEYQDIIAGFQTSWYNFLKGQYILYRFFRKGGLAGKYLEHRDLLRCSSAERAMLAFHASHPWRFSICTVVDSPARDFYRMLDVFHDREFLLYSPAINRTLNDIGHATMFFLLLTDVPSTDCLQTYGPVIAYRGMLPLDVYALATALDARVNRGPGILSVVNRNPIPFMMLMQASRVPALVHDGELLVLHRSDYYPPSFNPDAMKQAFNVEQKKGVYKLTLRGWGGHPHFAEAYYDRKTLRVLLTSWTERGYQELTGALAAAGHRVWPYPELMVTMAAIPILDRILHCSLLEHPYSDLFAEKPTTAEHREIERVNAFLDFLADDVNAGRPCDVDALARRLGVDVTLARQLYDTVRAQIAKHRKP